MEKFTTLTAIAAPYLRENVDTDFIIRVERCTGTPREELGRWAFEMARYLPGGAENPEFVFNQAPWCDAQILIGAENFGTGSSREHAVWALAGMGLRCIIAPSYGQIFMSNCFQNGLLLICLPQATVSALAGLAQDPATSIFTVDLEKQTINGTIGFEVEPRRKRMLLGGLDEIDLTLALEPKIAAFQAADRQRRPWIYPA